MTVNKIARVPGKVRPPQNHRDPLTCAAVDASGRLRAGEAARQRVIDCRNLSVIAPDRCSVPDIPNGWTGLDLLLRPVNDQIGKRGRQFAIEVLNFAKFLAELWVSLVGYESKAALHTYQ